MRQRGGQCRVIFSYFDFERDRAIAQSKKDVCNQRRKVSTKKMNSKREGIVN